MLAAPPSDHRRIAVGRLEFNCVTDVVGALLSGLAIDAARHRHGRFRVAARILQRACAGQYGGVDGSHRDRPRQKPSGKVERSAHTGDQHRQDQAEEHSHAAIRVADKRGVNPLAFLRSKRPTVGHSACEAQHRSLALSFYPGAIAVA